MDFYLHFSYHEFDCGSEWTRAWCLDTCESNLITILVISGVVVSNYIFNF